MRCPETPKHVVCPQEVNSYCYKFHLNELTAEAHFDTSKDRM